MDDKERARVERGALRVLLFPKEFWQDNNLSGVHLPDPILDVRLDIREESGEWVWQITLECLPGNSTRKSEGKFHTLNEAKQDARKYIEARTVVLTDTEPEKKFP
jgi:hypothetical protein